MIDAFFKANGLESHDVWKKGKPNEWTTQTTGTRCDSNRRGAEHGKSRSCSERTYQELKVASPTARQTLPPTTSFQHTSSPNKRIRTDKVERYLATTFPPSLLVGTTPEEDLDSINSLTKGYGGKVSNTEDYICFDEERDMRNFSSATRGSLLKDAHLHKSSALPLLMVLAISSIYFI